MEITILLSPPFPSPHANQNSVNRIKRTYAICMFVGPFVLFTNLLNIIYLFFQGVIECNIKVNREALLRPNRQQ
jgi:hypothetical protein